jgi:hypothetical protein
VTSSDRIRAYEKRERAVKLATTYTRKAEWWIEPGLGPDGLPFDFAYSTLLDAALVIAPKIVAAMPDDWFVTEPAGVSVFGPHDAYNLSDDMLEAAESVVAAIRQRRDDVKTEERIRKLEVVTGRTSEEAAAFRAKAAELRARRS